MYDCAKTLLGKEATLFGSRNSSSTGPFFFFFFSHTLLQYFLFALALRARRLSVLGADYPCCLPLKGNSAKSICECAQRCAPSDEAGSLTRAAHFPRRADIQPAVHTYKTCTHLRAHTHARPPSSNGYPFADANDTGYPICICVCLALQGGAAAALFCSRCAASFPWATATIYKTVYENA